MLQAKCNGLVCLLVRMTLFMQAHENVFCTPAADLTNGERVVIVVSASPVGGPERLPLLVEAAINGRCSEAAKEQR